MRIRIAALISCVAVAGVAALNAQAQTELVIDDFKESPYTRSLTDRSTFLTAYQTGPNIVGGVRQTNLLVAPAQPSFGQPTRLQIRPDGALVLSGGYKSYFGLILGYGYDAAGGANRLNLNLTGGGGECPGCDRFRVSFDGSDSQLNYLVQVYDGNNNIGTLYGTESTAERILPFHLDFPFADFVESSGNPIDWGHIDFIIVLIQTGNYLGGHDFALTKISAIPAPTE